MDERLTDRSRLVITNAREAAREYNHNFIGTEHILLGLLRTPGIAAELLQSLGITPKSVDAKVLEIVGSGEMTGPPMPPNAEAPFTPRGKRVIDLALREALSLGIVGEKNVDAEHILLALIRENQGIAARIMLESGARYRTIRKKLLHSPSPGVVVPEPADVAPVGASIRIGPTPEMRRVWETAAASALEEERLEISAEDLLLALTRDTTTAQLLADLGVDEAAVRRAIKRRQG